LLWLLISSLSCGLPCKEIPTFGEDELLVNVFQQPGLENE
jgi:hypothetical protein